jgi:hypothetical protein
MRHARHIRLIVAVSSIMTDGLMPFKSRSEAIVPVRLSEEAVVRVLMGLHKISSLAASNPSDRKEEGRQLYIGINWNVVP